jgi:hypothetical protein
MNTLSATNRGSLLVCALLTISIIACDNRPTAPESGYVKVSVKATGGDLDDAFEVVSGSFRKQVSANGSIVFALPDGTHPLTLTGIADNCLVDGNAALLVDVGPSDTTRVIFNIHCAPLGRSGVIAFVEAGRLVVMNASGSGRRDLSRGWNPSWSRDGTRLVYSAAECDDYSCSGSLGIVDPWTSQITALTTTGPSLDPAWSPVGDVIAFSDVESGGLYLYDIATATRSKVALDRDVHVSQPSWSPDGSRLAVTCYASGGRGQICILNRAGTGVRYLTSDVSTTSSEPSWSPDGTRIAFTYYAGVQGAIAVINVDGSGFRALTNGREPAWSPDGSQIIFSGDRGLYTIRVDGTFLMKVTDGLHYSPAWHP